jgi:hypothetical protein
MKLHTLICTAFEIRYLDITICYVNPAHDFGSMRDQPKGVGDIISCWFIANIPLAFP